MSSPPQYRQDFTAAEARPGVTRRDLFAGTAIGLAAASVPWLAQAAPPQGH